MWKEDNHEIEANRSAYVLYKGFCNYKYDNMLYKINIKQLYFPKEE